MMGKELGIWDDLVEVPPGDIAKVMESEAACEPRECVHCAGTGECPLCWGMDDRCEQCLGKGVCKHCGGPPDGC